MPAPPPEGPPPPDASTSDASSDGASPGDDPSAELAARAALLRRRVGAGGLDLPVEGTSMGATIRAGARVHVVAGDRPRRGEIWAALDTRGRLVVHRVRHLGIDAVVLRGDANPVDDPPLPRHLLLGRVVATSGPGRRPRRFGPLDRWHGAIRLRLRGAARRILGPVLATRRGRGYSACCPARDDTPPPRGDDDGER